MSKALYRKYRPQSFSEFINQNHVTRTITNAIKNGTISHAYLFSGPRGTGKTTLARLLAKSINCENRKGFEPCNQCPSCKEITSGQSMDLVEIDAASHRGIDNIRELRDGIRFSPTRLQYKVFIIDECHQLSKAAANALLKTLEEPPKHAVFVLATTEVHKMLPTILSRCQRFDFKKLSIDDIIKKLKIICKKESLKVEKGSLRLVALAARGSIRDAESLLDQVITFAGKDQLIEVKEVKEVLGVVEVGIMSHLTKLIAEKKKKEALDYLHKIEKRGVGLEEFTQAYIDYLRQGLLIKMGAKRLTESQLTRKEAEEMEEIIKSVTSDRMSKIIEIFLEASGKIKYSPIPELPMELAILDACK